MAGFEDEPAPAPERGRSEWAQQLEKSYTSATGMGSAACERGANPMVKIVGYEGGGGGGGGGGYGGGGSGYGGGRTVADSDGPGRGGGRYDNIAGAALRALHSAGAGTSSVTSSCFSIGLCVTRSDAITIHHVMLSICAGVVNAMLQSVVHWAASSTISWLCGTR